MAGLRPVRARIDVGGGLPNPSDDGGLLEFFGYQDGKDQDGDQTPSEGIHHEGQEVPDRSPVLDQLRHPLGVDGQRHPVLAQRDQGAEGHGECERDHAADQRPPIGDAFRARLGRRCRGLLHFHLTNAMSSSAGDGLAAGP